MPVNEMRATLQRHVAHPLAGSTTSNLLRLLWRNRNSVDDRARAATLVGVTMLLAPARMYETATTARPLREHSIDQSPVFVVGHARSGTTLLFRLLSRDEQFGFVRFRQAIFPSMCATTRPLTDRLLGGLAPEKRPTDDMTFHPDEPEEEEGALNQLAGTATGGFLYFPRNAETYFSKWALMRDLSPQELALWSRTRERVFHKASWMAGGKRLVTKNPWNTARLPQILDRWPDAPILHIVRHPYGVHLSAWNALRAGAHIVQLADYDVEDLREFFFRAYRDLLQAHLAQRAAVPAGQYDEIRYEDLVSDPLGTLRGVYERLGLEGWAAFEPRLRAYLGELAGYQPGRFRMERDAAARIAEEWAFAFEQWGYDPEAVVGIDED